MVAAVCCAAFPALADNTLDTGGLTFRDFSIADNGASFFRGGDPMSAGNPNPVPSKVITVDNDNGLARIRFESIKVEVALPLGWQATEDWERGVAYSGDRRYRVIVWRVDFAFEGVKDAEHYVATKSGSIQARRPTVKAQARKLGDGTFLVVYENAPAAQGDSEPRVVFDLVIPRAGGTNDGVLVTLGVPASDAGRGLKLLSLLRSKVKIDW